MKLRNLVPAALLSGLLALAGGASLSAQEVAAADAQAFIGDWTAAMQGPQGAIDMEIHVMDDGGQLAGQVGGPQGAMSDVESFSMSGESLMLAYTVDFGGQSAPVEVTLTPQGDELGVNMSFAGGQFSLDGTATKQ